MRRIINIFLASSITEFANERMAIENFIRNTSDKFEESYDVKIQPLLCENFDDAYSKIRKQEEYNEKIRKSDFCFFIFFTKVGEYTREEFEVARKKFEETGKPKIYTYFKVIHDEEAEQSLYDFMEELDKIFGHYYGTFEHIDTVKLRILLKLKLQEMDFLEIKIYGDDCVVDGRKALSLKNVSEFANNSIFKEQKAELNEVEAKYFKLKAKYEKGECSKAEENEYVEIATKRQNLIDAIEEVQKNIFNMSLRMCQDEARGEITLRQKEAYRLFEAGDLDGANSILDFAEIENDYLRDIAIMEANIRKRSEVFIRETKTKINILKTMVTRSTRFTEIEVLYDKIHPVVFKYNVELDAVLDFSQFLLDQNKHSKAYEVAKSLEEILKNSTEDDKRARICHVLGTICSDLPTKKSEAEKYQKKAIEICEGLAEVNPERFNPNLAGSYNNAGIFYNDHGQPDKAEMYYKKSIGLGEKLAEANPERFNPNLAVSYNNAGVFYNDQGQPDKAELYFKKAIEIREKLAMVNPERFNPDLATSYINAGVFCSDERQPDKAELYFKKAIEIIENLADINPERFNPDLAMSYNNAGIFYKDQGQPDKAEMYYKKSIEIGEKFAEVNPERFNPVLAGSYNNAGVFYKEQGQLDKAESYLLKAIEIREKLAETNPERFNHTLATSYNNIAEFYKEQGQLFKAKESYKKELIVGEKLTKNAPKRFNHILATSYFNYAIFVNDEMYYEKALALAKTNPDNPYCRRIIEALEGK